MSDFGVLIITPFFSPNIGGVETHLDDLTRELDSAGFSVFVETYAPLTTRNTAWMPQETRGNVHIRRHRWFGCGLFHQLEKHPLLDFLYLTPYLFARALFFLMKNSKDIDVIHAQGLNAGWMGIFLKRLFNKRLVISIHAVYEFKTASMTARFVKWILSSADAVLTLSNASGRELEALGIEKNRIKIYRYWIDLGVFRPLGNPFRWREKFSLPQGFIILFVGRLIKKKGIEELLASAKRLKDVTFVFIGEGPLEKILKEAAFKSQNIIFLGAVNNANLPEYYNAADMFCIPSQYEEGFGRVAMEAVACGIPVVGSKRGGIPEALDDTVAVLIEPTPENLTLAIEALLNDRVRLDVLKKNCRPYAEKYFSKANAVEITDTYALTAVSPE